MKITNEAITAAIAATAAAATPETRRQLLLRRGGPDNATNSRKGRPAFRPMKQSRADHPEGDSALRYRTIRKEVNSLTFD